MAQSLAARLVGIANMRAWRYSFYTLLLGIGLTTLTLAKVHHEVEAKTQAQFSRAVALAQNAISQRLTHSITALNGGKAAAIAANTLNRAMFRRYVAAGNLAAEFPGVSGLGFIERVPRPELENFLQREKADGGEDFKVLTSGEQDYLLVVKYIEPWQRNQPAWGFDKGQEETRRAAAQRAINTGQPALSAADTLIEDPKQGPGLVFFLPIYQFGSDPTSVEDRNAKLLGLFYAPLVCAELFADVTQFSQGMVTFKLYSALTAGPGQLIYSSTTSAANQPRFSASAPIEIGGQTLFINTYSTPLFERINEGGDLLHLALAGGLLSSLLALAVGLLASGRSRAEALARSMTLDLERLAKVAQYTTNSVILTDAQFKVTWVNKAYEKLTHYPLQQLVGTNPLGHLAEDQQPEALAAVSEAIAQGKPFRGEIFNINQYGHTYWSDMDVQPQHNSSGELTGFVVVKTDITERKRDQEHLHAALNKSESLWATIYQHAIVSVTDARGIITDVNEAFCLSSGYSREELVGRTHNIVNAGVHSPEFFAELWHHLKSGKSWRGEICNRTKSGSLNWVDTIIAPLNAEANALQSFISFRFDITSQKAIGERLKTSEAFLVRAGKIAGLGAWEVDLPSWNIRWSEQTRAIHEVPESFYPDFSNAGSFYDDDARLKLNEAIHKAIDQGDSFDMELPLTTGRGRQIWVRAVGEAEHHNGRCTRLVGTLQDVTETRLTQQRVKQVLERLDVATASAGIGVWEYDPTTGRLSGDERMYAMYGQTQNGEADAYQLWSQCVAPEDVLKARQEMAATLRGEKDFSAEYRVVWPSGEVRFLKSFARVLRDENGKPQRLYGVNFDITAIKRAEQELRSTSAFVQNVLDSASEMSIIATDPNLQITVFNTGAERLLGYSAAEMVARQTPMCIHLAEEVATRGLELTRQYGYDIGGSGVYTDPHVWGESTEWTYVHKQGFHIAVNLVITAMHSPEGEIVGYLGIAYDITQHKQFERSLRLATELAEQGSQAKSHFLANMSHEIRTPMNAILGMLQLLNHSALNARQRDYVHKTQGAAQSLLGLLNDILDFSKIEAGKLVLDPNPFCIGELMANLAVILAANQKKPLLEVIFDLDAELPETLVGDDLRLQQILTNLAGNAIKFTQTGEVVVSLKVKHKKNHQVELEIAVTDTGIGIAADQQAHVFAGFSQAEASTTRRFGGTGLGLAISQRLISLMGGELTLHSELGRGSRFAFAITLETGADPEPIEALTGKRILLIDDNANARAAFAKMATKLAWQLTSLASGAAAIELFTNGQHPHFDAVFIDIEMPECDGWQTRKTLLDLPQAQPLNIIMVGSPRGPAVMADQREEPLVLTKPITVKALVQALADDTAEIAGEQFSGSDVLAGLRILVVEDNINNQQVVTELLEEEGASIFIANNGLEGVEKAATLGLDLILMDIQMPVMDGVTATSEIRKRVSMAQLPIVAMTANAMSQDRDSCLEAGMNDHIGKPFVLADLIACILKHTRPGSRAKPQQTSAAEVVAETHAPAAITLEVDRATAIAMMGGRHQLYDRLFKKFIADLPATSEELQRLVAAEQYADACRHMHSLKGLCATLGINRLSGVAAAIEQILKKPCSEADIATATSTWSQAIKAALPHLEDLAKVADH